MGLRPAQCYSDIKKDRPYTRIAVKKPDRNYIGSFPQRKIRRYNMGHPLLKYDYVVHLKAMKPAQLRDNALESVRQLVNRNLQKAFKDTYFMKVRVFPHQMLRENKMAQGAGADRVSKGMSHAFGRVIGRAARVRKGSILFSILSFEENVDKTKEILFAARSRLGIPVKIDVSKDVKSIGTIPNKVRGVEKEKPAEKTEEETKEADTKTGDKKEADKKAPEKKDAKPAAKKK